MFGCYGLRRKLFFNQSFMENVKQIIANHLDKTHVELVIRCYSSKTVKAYLLSLKGYFKFFSSHLPPNYSFFGIDKNSDEYLIKKFLMYKKEQNCSPKTLHVYLSAIKFFYKEVIRNPQAIDIKFAKRQRKFPVVLSNSEIMAIIGTLQNLKHRLIVSLAYGAGLRVSEVTNLKIRDLNFEDGTISIRQSKGAKDRITILPESLTSDLKDFICNHPDGWDRDENSRRLRPGDDYLFLSSRQGKLSTRTLQKTFRAAKNKAKITKQATFHSLRHSFASHLLEANVNLRIIQELLGHQNIRTTEIYTHVEPKLFRNVKSPL